MSHLTTENIFSPTLQMVTARKQLIKHLLINQLAMGETQLFLGGGAFRAVVNLVLLTVSGLLTDACFKIQDTQGGKATGPSSVYLLLYVSSSNQGHMLTEKGLPSKVNWRCWRELSSSRTTGYSHSPLRLSPKQTSSSDPLHHQEQVVVRTHTRRQKTLTCKTN